MKKLLNLSLSMAFLLIVASCQVKNPDPYALAGSHPMIADSKTAVTSTELGQVIGYVHKGIFNYKGIPYAKAERFMPPVKPDPWEGVRSSRSYGAVCPINVASMILSDEIEFAQQHNFAYMNENCLNLNVWSPGINDGEKRPVMVWLHGGGYTAGSSCELPSYDGENLSRTGDVVVVSVNHRLNVLGFLDLSAVSDKYANSANVGILDLIAALEWVNKNISNFGGDPSNVTIFGQSGGGGKVTTLMYSPAANGLFHKAIMESGGGGGFASKETTQKVGIAILEELGIDKKDIDKIKDVKYDDLLAAGTKALTKVTATGVRAGWGPSLDISLIPYQPGDPNGDAISKDIPLIIGTNQVEFGSSSRDFALLTGDEEKIKTALVERYAEKTDAYITAFKKAYPNTIMASDMLDIDLGMRPGALRFAGIKSSVEGGAPVYNYLFSWHAPHLDGMIKSMHCQEIAFVFNNIEFNEQYSGGTPEAYALANKMSKTWATFAHTGNPNNDSMPQWESFTKDGGATMIFDNVSELKYNHDKELLDIVAAN